METVLVGFISLKYFPSSPFGGIPRNWKLLCCPRYWRTDCVPPSGGSLEIGNKQHRLYNQDYRQIFRSPFGGIPRNWKQAYGQLPLGSQFWAVPPSGGSLEIGNIPPEKAAELGLEIVPPSGGSLEIGNKEPSKPANISISSVPPSGGSLEIGNPS